MIALQSGRVGITRLCPIDVLHSMEVQSGWCRYDWWRHGARGCCVKSDCVALGLGLRAQIRSSSCLAAGYFWFGVVTYGGGTVQPVAVFKGDCLVLGLWFEGLELGRQAAWRPGIIGMVSSQLVAALCKQLPCLKVTAWFLGSGLRSLNSVVKLLGGRGTIKMVSSRLVAALCSSCRV